MSDKRFHVVSALEAESGIEFTSVQRGQRGPK